MNAPKSASDRLPVLSPEEYVQLIVPRKESPDEFRDTILNLVESQNPQDAADCLQIARRIEAALTEFTDAVLFTLEISNLPEAFRLVPIEDRGAFVRSIQHFLKNQSTNYSHIILVRNFQGGIPMDLPWQGEIFDGVLAELNLQRLNDQESTLSLNLYRKEEREKKLRGKGI